MTVNVSIFWYTERRFLSQLNGWLNPSSALLAACVEAARKVKAAA